jgi:hypothetical protein
VHLSRPKHKVSAAWLGILALGLNALLPVHLAFDLAGALSTAHAGHIERLDQRGHGHDLLAQLVGHHNTGGKSGSHHQVDCAVCATLGALTGFALAADVALPVPRLADVSATLASGIDGWGGTFPTAYRSRAPPCA